MCCCRGPCAGAPVPRVQGDAAEAGGAAGRAAAQGVPADAAAADGGGAARAAAAAAGLVAGEEGLRLRRMADGVCAAPPAAAAAGLIAGQEGRRDAAAALGRPPRGLVPLSHRRRRPSFGGCTAPPAPPPPSPLPSLAGAPSADGIRPPPRLSRPPLASPLSCWGALSVSRAAAAVAAAASCLIRRAVAAAVSCFFMCGEKAHACGASAPLRAARAAPELPGAFLFSPRPWRAGHCGRPLFSCLFALTALRGGALPGRRPRRPLRAARAPLHRACAAQPAPPHTAARHR